MSNLTDEELAGRARDGCAASFEQLVRRFQRPLLNFLRQRGAGADADDLLQETFLRAYANLARYRSRYRVAPWLFTIARRLSINHYHRMALPRGVLTAGDSPVDSLPSGGRTPDEVVAAAEDRNYLWLLAASVLSEEEMTALWLYYVEELPAREIGTVLGRSWLGVKSLLSRARKKLKPRLSRFIAPSDAELVSSNTASAADRSRTLEPARTP